MRCELFKKFYNYIWICVRACGYICVCLYLCVSVCVKLKPSKHATEWYLVAGCIVCGFSNRTNIHAHVLSFFAMYLKWL